jgi:hypothetical protein
MKTKPLTFLLALTFLFLFSGSVFANDYQDYQDGLYAHNRGDFKTAYSLWLPLAEQGHAGAQFIVATRHAAKQLAGKSFPDRPQ